MMGRLSTTETVAEKQLSQCSSFIIQPFRRKYLKEYFLRYSRDNDTALWDDNVASVLEEQGYSIEDSPRSIYSVEKLYQALAKYAPELAPKVDLDDAHIKAGIKLAYASFAKPKDVPYLKLPAFTPKFIQSITSNRKASSGLTAWGQTKAESYVRAYERGLQEICGVKHSDPCVAFKRTQFNGKTRLVWGFPYANTAKEGLFARPLIEQFKNGNSPMSFGMTTGALGARLRASSYHKKWAYSTDISSYDSSLAGELILIAFSILETWFHLSEFEPTSGVRYSQIWQQNVDYFIHTPIVMPNGSVYKGKRHGVPSGSYFTQMIDSVVNTIICGAIASKFNMFLDKSDLYVLGDDLLFWSNRHVKLKDIADYGSRTFGVNMNADKSAVFNYQDDIHYLGRDWKDGVPDLDEKEILKRMAQPETFRKYSSDPGERTCQVRLLLLSYAAVYRRAYSIALSVLSGRNTFSVGSQAIQSYMIHGDQHQYQVEDNPNFYSGLVRYLRTYHQLGECDSPLALQFWK